MNIDYSGKIFQITSQNKNDKVFEYARRAHGTRTIVDNGKEILLIEEYRDEQNKLDLRLPGGKVFDTLEEYLNNSEDIVKKAKKGALREVKEETGIVLNDLDLLKVSKCLDGSVNEDRSLGILLKYLLNKKNL